MKSPHGNDIKAFNLALVISFGTEDWLNYVGPVVMLIAGRVLLVLALRKN
jgi:hypothetical protein